MNKIERKIYGMIHLAPLPGTPYYNDNFEEILDTAVQSAYCLYNGGAHGCLVQTVDKVYRSNDTSDPARVAAASLIVKAISDATDPKFEIGVQLMKNDINSSIAVAKVARGYFVRATALIGPVLADHGTLYSDPYKVMAYRKTINAQKIRIIADIASIHHKSARSLGDLARHTLRVGAYAVAIGNNVESRTLEWMDQIQRSIPSLPVYIAGHTNHDNASRLLLNAHGAFVGSCLETGGWAGSIDERKVKAYMNIVHSLPPLETKCNR